MGFKAMRKSMTLVLLPALALALAAPGAGAATAVAPPGVSEADQYFETVPGSSGPRSPDGSKKEEDAVRDGSLTPATGRALRRRGTAGQAVATAVARTAPPARPARGQAAGGRGGGSSRPAQQVEAPGSGGLGVLFPLALAATAAATVAFAVARRRRPVAR